MKTGWIDARATSFLSYLERYRNDRGALAGLRGGISESRRPRAWPLLGGFKDAIGNVAFETVAALWAADERGDVRGGCLGSTCRTLAGKYDGKTGKFEHDTFQSRFKRLLSCDPDEIAARIVPIVLAAHAKEVPVDYARLLSDLVHWNDKVQTEWAKAFWGAPEPDDAGIRQEEKEAAS